MNYPGTRQIREVESHLGEMRAGRKGVRRVRRCGFTRAGRTMGSCHGVAADSVMVRFCSDIGGSSQQQPTDTVPYRVILQRDITNTPASGADMLTSTQLGTQCIQVHTQDRCATYQQDPGQERREFIDPRARHTLRF